MLSLYELGLERLIFKSFKLGCALAHCTVTCFVLAQLVIKHKEVSVIYRAVNIFFMQCVLMLLLLTAALSNQVYAALALTHCE